MKGTEDKKSPAIVAILSSNHLLRLGLQRIVENENWIKLIGNAANTAALDDLLIRERPHIMIVDTEIANDVTGVIQKIKMMSPQIRVILLSALQDSECTRQAIDIGVDGIVLKVQPSAVLIATIDYLSRLMTEGQPPNPVDDAGAVDLSTMTHLLAPSAADSCQAKWPHGLTEREREVIRWIGQGLSNKDIADRLCISSITVRHHLTNIFDKLGVSNRQKLLIRAHQYGIVELTARA